MSQTRRRGLAERCFRSSLASEPAKVDLGPMGSGIVESRVNQVLGLLVIKQLEENKTKQNTEL